MDLESRRCMVSKQKGLLFLCARGYWCHATHVLHSSNKYFPKAILFDYNSATPLSHIYEFVPFQDIPRFCRRQIGQNFGLYRSIVQYFVHELWVFILVLLPKVNQLRPIYCFNFFSFHISARWFLFVFSSSLTARIKFVVMAKACQQMVLPHHDIRPCGRFLLIIRSIPFST